jgi:hypothetical protein
MKTIEKIKEQARVASELARETGWQLKNIISLMLIQE